MTLVMFQAFFLSDAYRRTQSLVFLGGLKIHLLIEIHF